MTAAATKPLTALHKDQTVRSKVMLHAWPVSEIELELSGFLSIMVGLVSSFGTYHTVYRLSKLISKQEWHIHEILRVPVTCIPILMLNH